MGKFTFWGYTKHSLKELSERDAKQSLSHWLHSWQLVHIFSNYYEFFQELLKYELLLKKLRISSFPPNKNKIPR